ncbi:MAG: L-2-hydroxyglutarate oxidase [Planctomycetes bacterium]|nr:L-2-hydroxyglutarate oxidase [Planctomycetota bacterium]
MQRADLLVVGGGIVGLATAQRFGLRQPGARVVVLEKERAVAAHQTGHNSGVIHSGLYYKPGSLKARNCRRGKRMLEDFCRAESLPFELCGKVVVAVDASEVPRLEKLEARGRANGVDCTRIELARLKELEPHVAGVAALHVPETGIVDYTAVCVRLAEHVARAGGEVITGAKVTGLRPEAGGVAVQSTAGDFSARTVINCAGLHSDRVAELERGERPARIVPFRGEYWELAPEAAHLCKHLIYPVPDPSFPFLGVHYTRMVKGGVECGPNAVLALAREGYRWTDVNLADLWDVFSYGAFWKLAAKHHRTGGMEVWRSLSKRAFTRSLQRLIPEVREEHLRPAHAGVRAQALAPDGALVDDFLIRKGERILHVCNAPSPAATSSLSIGETLVDELAEFSR